MCGKINTFKDRLIMGLPHMPYDGSKKLSPLLMKNVPDFTNVLDILL